jgi:hypothetical protein
LLNEAYAEDCMRVSSEKKETERERERESRSKIKVMLVVFFNWKGIVHHEFVPRGQMLHKQLYQDVLARLRDAVRRKTP